MTDWLIEFTPTTENELIGRVNEIKQLKEWITNIKEYRIKYSNEIDEYVKTIPNKKRKRTGVSLPPIKTGIIITGKCSFGKSTLARVALNDLDMRFTTFGTFETHQLKEIISRVQTDKLTESSMNIFFSDFDPETLKLNDEAILLDGMEYLSKGELSTINKILQHNNNRGCIVPIIITINIDYIKKLRIVKRFCNTITLKAPLKKELISFIDRVKIAKGINMTKDIYPEILIRADDKFSRITFILYEFYNTLKSSNNINKINRKTMENTAYGASSNSRYISINELMLRFLNCDSMDEFIELDHLAPKKQDFGALIYENYIKSYEKNLDMKNIFNNEDMDLDVMKEQSVILDRMADATQWSAFGDYFGHTIDLYLERDPDGQDIESIIDPDTGIIDLDLVMDETPYDMYQIYCCYGPVLSMRHNAMNRNDRGYNMVRLIRSDATNYNSHYSKNTMDIKLFKPYLKTHVFLDFDMMNYVYDIMIQLHKKKNKENKEYLNRLIESLTIESDKFDGSLFTLVITEFDVQKFIKSYKLRIKN